MIIRQQFSLQSWRLVLSLSFLAFILIFLISLFFGAVSISAYDIVSKLVSAESANDTLIFWQLRVPRALLAALVGAMLAICGAITQGLFRNPLADPSLIGISAGASAGASIVIVLFSTLTSSYWGMSLITIGAFIGGLMAVVFVYRLATTQFGTSVTTMLLAGIAMSFIAGSISNFLEFFADNEMLRRMSLWRMGGVDTASYGEVSILAFVSLLIIFVLPSYYTALNAILLGESEARHIGIDVEKIKRRCIVIVAAGVGCSVAFSGTIAFIGLVVPHIIRIIIGPNHRYLIPLSGLLGAALLVVADAFARSVLAPTELPLGLLTALIGAPVFIGLLSKRYRYGV